jgi:hypothetical protein
MHRRAVALILPFVALVACTSLLGDFAVNEATVDAGGTTDTTYVETGTSEVVAVVQAITSDVSVYVGQTATVDASSSTTSQGALTFSWTVASAPPGSRVRTGSLAGAASARASLVPDVSGEYALRVTVHADGSSDTASAKVHAALPQVLFAQGTTADGGGGSAYYAVADFDGGNARPVLCPDVITDASAPIARLVAYAGRAYDYWEAPPGQTSKFAAFTVDFVPDSGLFGHLWAGTTASSCDASPVDFGPVGFGPGRPFGSEPHFNPGGSRFVVFDRQWRIVTYPADDASAPQVIATFPVPYAQARSVLDPPGFDAGAGYLFEPPRVEWTAGGLAWAQPTAGGWEIVTAPDIPDAGPPTPYMICNGVTPREIAMLRDGTVIAAYRLTPQSSENLYQLKPDARQNCSHEQQYTNLADSGRSMATDFDVSPDGTQIAFLQNDPSLVDASPWMQGGSPLPGGYVYVVPVSGGTPTQVSTEPAIYGPRWIGGGTALVFTRLDGISSTGNPATSVVVVAPDGGARHVIAQGDGVTTFVATSGSGACSVGGAAAEDGAKRGGVSLWLLAVAGPVARRQRRRRAP